MSAKATFWAWEQEELRSPSKLVLLCMANVHNDDSERCDPGPAYIKKKTGLDVKTIRSAIKDLIKLGLISAHQRPGKTPNYLLNFDAGDLFSPYPNSDIPKNNPTQKRVYPDSVLTLPKNGHDPTQIRVPNLKDTKKNLKDNYKGLDLSKIPECIDREIVVEFINHREALKKKITQYGLDRFLKTAASVQENKILNISPSDAITEVIEAGWIGLKIEWLVNRLQGQGYASNQQNQSGSNQQRSGSAHGFGGTGGDWLDQADIDEANQLYANSSG